MPIEPPTALAAAGTGEGVIVPLGPTVAVLPMEPPGRVGAVPMVPMGPVPPTEAPGRVGAAVPVGKGA